MVAWSSPDCAQPEIEKPGARYASQMDEMVEHLSDFNMDELREIPVLTEGASLDQGGIYVDLADPAREPFTALGGARVAPGQWCVPKSEVPYAYWNRLIRVEEAERRE